MIFRILPLLSRPSKQGASALVLPGFAFLAVTALLAIVLGGSQTFWGYDDEMAGLYWAFTAIALALLIVPLLSLGAAAARLSARRRDDRLAILRLLGATGRSTAGIAVIEAAGIAFVGAVAGALLSYAVAPLVGLIQFRGEALGTSGVALPPLAAALLVLGIVGVATGSALLSLRRVIISPLGVVTKQSAPKVPWLQALIAVAIIVIASVVTSNIGGFSEVGVVALIGAFGVCFALALLALDLIGAWVLAMFGKAKARRAKRPADLIAARLVLESPRAAWRQVSGVAMSSFMAVFAGSGIALMNLAAGDGSTTDSGVDQYLVGDVQTGVALTVIGTFIMVACSVAVNQAAQILDRRDVTRSLAIMGTPIEVQDAARRGATMLPLLIASVGSAALAAVLLFPLLGMAILFAPLSVAVTLSTIAVGVLIVVATMFATRPLLRQVARV
ncbi:FtsX-like permease family protein [Leucobacter sp. NPDC058333]|uniref:FtsX-like permease family protein n=1 Tax=Leucobacter sp. NPDC058333 TaxID=3346450 RepID=UPI00365C5137